MNPIYNSIVRDPTNAMMWPTPPEAGAFAGVLAATVQAADFAAVREYMSRYTVDVQVLFLRMLLLDASPRVADCMVSPTYTAWLCEPEMRRELLG